MLDNIEEDLIMTSFHKMISVVKAETIFQKVLEKENISSEEITRAKQVNVQALLEVKNDFDKAVSEINTKYSECLIPKIIPIRRGDAHAR